MQHERHGQHAMLQSDAAPEQEAAKGFRGPIVVRSCMRKEWEHVAVNPCARDAAGRGADNRKSAHGKRCVDPFASSSAPGSLARSAGFSTEIPAQSHPSNLIPKRP
jgi:hypothetical protein